MAGPKKKTKLTAAKVQARQSRRGKASKKSLGKQKKHAAEIVCYASCYLFCKLIFCFSKIKYS